MNDDDRRRVEAIKRAWQTLQHAAQAVLDCVKRIGAALAPFIRALRGIQARERWRDARRNARMLSRHPDLRALDGWLDALYPGIP